MLCTWKCTHVFWLAAHTCLFWQVSQAALGPPRVLLDVAGDNGRGQVVFEVPVPLVRWNVKGPELVYTHTFLENTSTEILQAGNSTLHTTWKLPVNVTFSFERNYFGPLASYFNTRELVSNGVPEIRIPVQDVPIPKIINRTLPFNYSEEFELDCVDRQDVSMRFPGSNYYRAYLPCECDPELDLSCFFCESSGRFYLLRERKNMAMPIREVNFSMYVNGDVLAPYATTMGVMTNISVQSSSGTHVLTDIREGYTVDSFYNADWSPYTRDVYRPARPSPQTFPNSSYDYLVKWIGRAYPSENSGEGSINYPDDGTLAVESLPNYYVIANNTEPGLIIPKTQFNKGFGVWTENLVMSPEVWRARKSAACAAGTDQVLSTNYDSLVNLVNRASNPVRKCVPLGDRGTLEIARHYQELGYPADYPYASAIPNPLVPPNNLNEGQLLSALLYRIACDYDADHYAPVYFFKMNRTELEVGIDPSVGRNDDPEPQSEGSSQAFSTVRFLICVQVVLCTDTAYIRGAHFITESCSTSGEAGTRFAWSVSTLSLCKPPSL